MIHKGMSLLIVDDEEDIRSVIHERFVESGHDASTAATAEEAVRLAREKFFDVAVMDIKLPGTDGISLWRALKELQPVMEVIFITGHATVDTALEAMKLGAYDFLTKPLELSELEILVQKAYEKKLLRKQTVLLREELARHGEQARMIGKSEALQSVLRQIHQVARTDTPVLIEGETGTGKELIARAVHDASPRSQNQLVAVNCSTLQETLLENELFGHEKGAFTGAISFKRGLFESADEGTLFIDEIGEMHPNAQVKLLRVLETGTFRRLGDTRECRVDVRVVCATNRRLEDEVRKNKFRDDLYYRLNVFRIEVPPLRERREDVPLLAYHFLRNGRAAQGDAPTEIAPEALKLLLSYDWPGNVRELANAIEHATVVAMGKPVLEPVDLPVRVRQADSAASASRIPWSQISAPPPSPRYYTPVDPGPRSQELRDVVPPAAPAHGPQIPSGAPARTPVGVTLADLEKVHILATVDSTDGNRTRAAKLLGISVRHLRRKLHEYGYGKGGDTADGDSGDDAD